jgi:anaerobic selenocysteine-containing dehydrogenase
MTQTTYCRICEAACGLIAETRPDGSVKLSPDRDHPVSKGYICAKGTRFTEVATHPSRITTPMLRDDTGVLQPVSWSRAFSWIAEKLQSIRNQYGAHSVGLYYGNPIAFSALGTVGMISFVKALQTRNVFSAGTQDCQNKFAAAEILHGSPVIHPIPDLAHTKFAIFFGSNPAVSQSSFLHLEGGTRVFDDLIARGGDVLWVDPRQTESARRWGSHLAIRPNTDIWLILALLQLVTPTGVPDNTHCDGIESFVRAAHQISLDEASARTGISIDAIRSLAEKIQSSGSVALHMSVGVNQSEFATLSYLALQALSYVTANLDQEGGNLFHPVSLVLDSLFKLGRIGTDKVTSRIGSFQSVLDSLPAGIMADEMLTPGDGQIKAMFVIAGDPVLSVPGEKRLREAFSSLECLVSIDMFENETAKYADLILPTTSWLERWDVATTTAPFQHGALLQSARPVMRPPGEAREELWIFSQLLTAIQSYNPLRWLGRLPLSSILPSFGYGFPSLTPRANSYLGRGPRTPGHKLRFWSSQIEQEFTRLSQSSAPTNEMVLLGRRRKLGHNAWLHHGNRDGDTERVAWMNPEDLVLHSLTDGAVVTLSIKEASISLPVKGKAEVLRGTVVVPHGIADANLNAIIPSGPAMIEVISGQHKMTSIPVQILPASHSQA